MTSLGNTICSFTETHLFKQATNYYFLVHHLTIWLTLCDISIYICINGSNSTIHLRRRPWNFRIRFYLNAGFYILIALPPDSFQVNHKTTMEFSGSKTGLLQNEDWKRIIHLLTLKSLSMTFPLNLFIIVFYTG